MRLRLEEFFKEESEDMKYNPFKNKSKWTPPPNRDIVLEAYIQAVRRDVRKSLDETPKRRCIDNLTKLERKAMSSLRTREDIIIKWADKGSATIVMSKEDYITKVMQHLNNEQH